LAADALRLSRVVTQTDGADPSAVIPGPERSEGARNLVVTGWGYWIPRSPRRGALE
jgi:hypothetical protein